MIGVILMVAVTVILAAVIAAFVFGMGSNVNKTKLVAATAQISGDSIVVTYQGGANDGELDRSLTAPLKVTVTDGSATPATLPPISGLVFASPWSVGSQQVYAATTGPYHVSVSATFTDGTSQVILDTNVGAAPST